MCIIFKPNMLKKLTLEKFKEVYALVPRLTIEVIVKTPEGIILSKRSIDPYKGFWHIPGGTVFLEEKLEDAVIRVAGDEIGLEVGITKFLGFIYYPEEKKYGGVGWTVGAAFQAFVEGGKLGGNEDGKEVGVFKKLPEKVIDVQAEFLKKHGLFE